MESRIFCSTKCYNLYENGSGTIQPGIIYLGSSRNLNRKVYLHFVVESIPSEAVIESAYLILYERNVGVHIVNERYPIAITPTYEYINPYFYDYHDIPLIGRCQLRYEQASWRNVLMLNVSRLVTAWVSGNIQNYGCVLELRPYYESRAFAGVQLPGVEPFLKVSYRMPNGKILRYYEDEIDLSSHVEIMGSM